LRKISPSKSLRSISHRPSAISDDDLAGRCLCRARARRLLSDGHTVRPEPCPCFTLTVAVLVHRGFFPGGGGGNWHGLTVIQATLADDAGRELDRFRADGHDAQWNAFGGASGTKAAQQSLRDALRKLVRQMAQHDLR
jgi:hypothetical protein